MDLPGSSSETLPEEGYCVQMSPLVEFRGDFPIQIPGSASFPSLLSTSLIFMRSFSPTNRLASRVTSPAPAAKVMDGCVGWAEVAAQQGASQCCQTGHTRVSSRMKTRARAATGAREDI